MVDTGFTILRVATDAQRDVTVPIGAIAWDAAGEWFDIRLPQPDQRVEGVTQAERTVATIAAQQIRRWAAERRVPYSPKELKPYTGEFWNAAARALTTGVRIDSPRAMERMENASEMDSLFEAIVQPRQPRASATKRLETVVSEALGRDLAKRTTRHLTLRAFEGAEEDVMRGAKGPSGVMIIEAVNLAGRDARKDADALVSRLMRVREGLSDNARQRIVIVVGYAASPGGLNGETHMRDWIHRSVTDKVFDLRRQSREMQLAVSNALSEIDLQGSVFT